MSAFDYDRSNVPSRYPTARLLPPVTISEWLAAIARFVPSKAVRRIVDVGCGTGRFTRPLQEHFDATVLGIDPSRNMLSTAGETRTPKLRFVGGRAESLPVRTNCIDVFF